MRFDSRCTSRIDKKILIEGLLFVLCVTCVAYVAVAQSTTEQPQWIWAPSATDKVPSGTCHFRKTIDIKNAEAAAIHIAAYDRFELYINGKRIGTGNKQGTAFDIIDYVADGKNTFAVKVEKSSTTNAGLWARIEFKAATGQPAVFVSDGTWRTSQRALPLWQRPFYSASNWRYARSLQVPAESSDAKAQQKTSSLANHGARSSQQVQGHQPDTHASVSKDGKKQSVGRAIRFDSLTRPDFRVPRQFEVQHVASHFDVGSVIAMTFNEFGQIVVSTEGGSLRLVSDSNGDGTFDRVKPCCEIVSNVQGIAAVNGDLIVTGSGPEGSALYRLSDDDKDGFFEQSATLLTFSGTPGEHGAHAVVLGPDGWIYTLIGNHAMGNNVGENGPYRDPYEGDLVPRFEDPGGHANGVKSPGGTIVRIDPETLESEWVVGGLRNPYDIAFNADGQLFTHDSDMESDEGTTWYRPTQLFHTVPGADLGWRSGWAKWPGYFIDSLPAIADTGRGSPAGLTFYEHDSFPKKYRGTLFSCDWTGGQILVMRCNQDGAGYAGESTTFLKGQPLNATDTEVGPDGWLYFSTGGRGTRGSVYRVVWKGSPQDLPKNVSAIDAVLRQPQIQSAWARQRIAIAKQKAGTGWATGIRAAVLDDGRPINERIQGLRTLNLHGPAPSADFLLQISRDSNPEIRATAASLITISKSAVSPKAPLAKRLVAMLNDPNPAVRREVCLGITRTRMTVGIEQFAHILASDDCFESLPARRLLESQPIDEWEHAVLKSSDQRVFLQGSVAMMVASPTKERGKRIVGRTVHLLQDYVSDENFLDLLRVLQLTLHRTQLTAADVPELTANLAEEFPSSDAHINRELVRLLAYLQVDSIMDRYLAELERPDIDPAERIHLATHLSFIRRGWETDQKLTVFRYLDPPDGAGNSVPGYLQNVSIEFGKTLTESETRLAIERGDEFRSAAMAAIMRYPEQLSADQIEQLKRLDRKLLSSHTVASKRLKIAIVAVLSRDGSAAATEYLQRLFDEDETRRVEVAYGLSENITLENWEFVVRSLPILDDEASRSMLKKLRTVTKWPTSPEPYRQVIRVAERLQENGAVDAIALLEHWQGFASSQDRVPWAKAIVAWKRWYAKKYPDALPIDSADEETTVASTSSGSVLTRSDGRWDYESLTQFVQSSEIARGSAERGLAAFVKADCAKCHRHGSTGETIGPDLTDLAKRFRASETLEAIVFPSKVISQQYASKTIVTADGIIHSGIVAAGASDEIVVLKSDGRSVRIEESEIEEIVPQTTSVMPEKLLDRLSQDEIRDLFTLLTGGGTRVAAGGKTVPQR